MDACVSELQKDIKKNSKCCLLCVLWLEQHTKQQHLLENSEESMLLILKQTDLGKWEQMWASR